MRGPRSYFFVSAGRRAAAAEEELWAAPSTPTRRRIAAFLAVVDISATSSFFVLFPSAGTNWIFISFSFNDIPPRR